MAAYQFARNYDGRRHTGWNPFVPDDGGGYRRPPPHHHPKNHVAFKTEQEEIRPSSDIQQQNGVVYNNDRSTNNAPKSVDEEAEAFIQHEHSRIQFARLRSLNPV